MLLLLFNSNGSSYNLCNRLLGYVSIDFRNDLERPLARVCATLFLEFRFCGNVLYAQMHKVNGYIKASD